MVDAMVRTNLGTFGTAILEFYKLNSLWINGLFLLIALIIVLGRWNYSQFLTLLLADFRASEAEKLAKKNRGQLRSALKKAVLPWAEASKGAWMPYFIPPGRIKFILKSDENLQKLFEMDKLLDALLK